MPWEFEGTDKNPLRLKTTPAYELPTKYRRTSKLGPKLALKLNRIVLSPLETMLAVAVLSETVQQLNIFLAKVPPIEPKFEFSGIKLKAKGPVAQETIETDEYKLFQIKVSTHMMNMNTLLYMIRDDLLLNKEPVGLRFYNDLQHWALQEETEIAEAYQFVSKRVRELKQNLREAQEMCKATVDLESGLATVKAQFEEACSGSTIMQEYSMKYQKVRIEQNTLKIKMAEAEHKKKLYSNLKEIEDEHSAHQLILRYLNQATEEVEKKFSYWSNKYDEDVEDIDYRIASYDQEIPNLVSDIAKLLTSYYSRELEMSNFVRWRDHHLKMKDIECGLGFFASIIQAWWRGTMVRWEIGPYAPKKPKRKPLTPSTTTTLNSTKSYLS